MLNCLDWKMEPDAKKAARLFIRSLRKDYEQGEPLTLRLDLRESPQDRDRAILSFYKQPRVQWANPLQCRLDGTFLLYLHFKKN